VHATNFSDEWSNFGYLLELLYRAPDWHADAACKEHPEVNFFPKRGDDGRQAKGVCAGCLVRTECADWALEQGSELKGIWGGMSELDRRHRREERLPERPDKVA
jgi:WhiB family redox-sensing transcriptional regulator